MMNKYRKRFLTLLAYREKKIKITVRYQCTLIRMAKIKNTDSTKC